MTRRRQRRERIAYNRARRLARCQTTDELVYEHPSLLEADEMLWGGGYKPWESFYWDGRRGCFVVKVWP